MSTALPLLDPDAWRDRVRAERRVLIPADVEQRVAAIIGEVRDGGDAALRRWTRDLDGADVAVTRVPGGAMEAAWAALDPALQEALRTTAAVIRDFHLAQAEQQPRGDDQARLLPVPLSRAACYVPGGRAAYPSTVLMSVIPAQVAGVGSIAVCSPPGEGALPHPLVMAACHLLGVTELHAAGGAQAVAALAYGTESIAAADIVVGPGNVWVTAAKRAVAGVVGIDQIAGPSEILVIASDGADPRFISADLISQLEHDPLAWAVLLSDSQALIDAVAGHFAEDAENAVRSAIIAQAAGRHAAAVRCANLGEAAELAAFFAPEHLSLQGAAAEALLPQVRNAGAVFVGAFSPVSIGDYIAGPNHTLPTQGAGRYRGPLSVMDFLRWTSIVQMDEQRYAERAPVARRLAAAEGLAAHDRALALRLEATEVRR